MNTNRPLVTRPLVYYHLVNKDASEIAREAICWTLQTLKGDKRYDDGRATVGFETSVSTSRVT